MLLSRAAPRHGGCRLPLLAETRARDQLTTLQHHGEIKRYVFTRRAARFFSSTQLEKAVRRRPSLYQAEKQLQSRMSNTPILRFKTLRIYL